MCIRDSLLAATERSLATLARGAARRTRTPFDDATLGQRVGRVINHYKMAKHFTVTIDGGRLSWTRRPESIQQEARLDGFYVIRTSVPAGQLSAADAVRHYKGLARVERAFRCLKGIDLRVRPIHHRTEAHVRAHIFLCLLAYYVEWHLRQAWAPLMFADEALETDRQTRDPVAPATPSPAVRRKKAERQLSLIHISEPTRLGMISYAVFCLKKKKTEKKNYVCRIARETRQTRRNRTNDV